MMGGDFPGAGVPALAEDRRDELFPGLDTGAKCGNHAVRMKATGRYWVGRYYTRSFDWRTLLKEEARQHSNAGLFILSIGQHRADSPAYFSPANGREDAKWFTQHAARCEQPAGSDIYFACDTDQIPTTLPALLRHFDAAAEVMAKTSWRMSVYGDPDACMALIERGLVRNCMLANARGWRTKEQKDWQGWDVCQYAEVKPPASGFPFAIDPGEARGLERCGMWRYSDAPPFVA